MYDNNVSDPLLNGVLIFKESPVCNTSVSDIGWKEVWIGIVDPEINE